MHGIPDTKAKAKSTKKKPAKSQKFFEALQEVSGDVADAAVHELAGNLPKVAFEQISGQKKSGELKPNQAVDVSQTVQETTQPIQEKKEQFGRFQREFLDIRRQEKMIFRRSEQEAKMQIAVILEELKKLSISTKNLAKEVEIASKQVPVEPGVYHVNFLQRLRRTIILFKKKIDESATWLETFNRRGKKRGYYWAQVKKSGTKFMLSQERYMSTQAG